MANKKEEQTAQGSANAKPAANEGACSIIKSNLKYVQYDEGGRIVSNEKVKMSTIGGANVSGFQGRDAGAGANREKQYSEVVTPDMRIQIQDEAKFDNRSVQLLGVKMESKPVDPSADISALYDASIDYSIQGVAPGTAPVMKQGYARAKALKTISKVVAVKGQTASNSVAVNNLYPSVTQRPVPDDDDNIEMNVNINRTNYLLKGIKFRIGKNGRLMDVIFDGEDLGATAITSEMLDVLPDHARIDQNQAEQEIEPMIEKILAKGDDFYTPIADGIPQPAKHIAMLRAITDMEGAIAMSLGRHAFEAQGAVKMFKSWLGAGDGSIRAASYCARGRGTTSRLAKDANNQLYLSASDYATEEWQSASLTDRYDRVKDWSTVAAMLLALKGPSAIRRSTHYTSSLLKNEVTKEGLAAIAAYFDAGDFLIDEEAFRIMDNVKWTENADGSIGGLTHLGIILPFDPEKYFTYGNAHPGVDVPAWSEMLRGACSIRSVTSPIAGRVSSITSPLLNAMVKYINDDFGRRFSQYNNDWETLPGGSEQYADFYLEISPEIDRMCASDIFFGLSLKYLPYVQQYVNLHYNQYRSVYGQDLRMYKTAKPLKYSDLIAGSFGDINSEPVLKPTSALVELWMDMPRHLRVEKLVNLVGEGVCRTAYGIEQEWYTRNLNGGFGIEDRIRWPVFQTGYMKNEPWTRLLAMDVAKFYYNVDAPIVERKFDVHEGDGVSLHDMEDVWTERNPKKDNTLQNRITRSSSLYPTKAITHFPGVFSGAVNLCGYTAETEMSLPTYMGRVVPDVMGYSAVPGDVSSSDLLYIWEDLDVTGNKGSVTLYPVEAMCYGYLRQVPLQEATFIGEANYCDLIMIHSAPIPIQEGNNKGYSISRTADLAEGSYFNKFADLATHYGLPLDADSAKIEPTALTKAEVDGTMLMTGLDNSMVSIFTPKVDIVGGVTSPFDGCISKRATKDLGVFADDRYDQQMDVLFGLKYFQNLYCTKLFEKLRLDKFGSANLCTDNEMEKTNAL